tara:strand:- start:5722 stop:6195 length:474 start_codon:yes stop_codon:yes gene_type:complete
MFNVVLFEPEIPPNTGNIIRLCANTGAKLHLIHPLGFEMNAKELRRAGLDYIDWSIVYHYNNFEDYIEKNGFKSLYAVSTKGKKYYSNCNFFKNDSFIFGPETRGLPQKILDKFETEKILKIPMLENNRSLNLSNATSIIIYEAWKQIDFEYDNKKY